MTGWMGTFNAIETRSSHPPATSLRDSKDGVRPTDMNRSEHGKGGHRARGAAGIEWVAEWFLAKVAGTTGRGSPGSLGTDRPGAPRVSRKGSRGRCVSQSATGICSARENRWFSWPTRSG